MKYALSRAEGVVRGISSMYNSKSTTQNTQKDVGISPPPSKQVDNIHIANETTTIQTGGVAGTEFMAIRSDERSIEDEVRAAQAICPLIRQIHESTLWTAHKIFSASRDKRVRVEGCLLIAHLLRFSIVVQTSLFPGTEICDVAKICIPNIRKISWSRAWKQASGWPWSYETTLKSIDLLIAAEVLITRPGEPGIYYLPLGPYVLLPDHASQQIEKLAQKRAKVSRSAAFKRTTVHCALLEEPHIVDSPFGPEVLQIDESEMQRFMSSVCATLRSEEHIALKPTTIAQLTKAVARHAPRVLKKRDGRFIVRPKEEAAALLSAPRSTTGDEIVDSSSQRGTRTGGREQQNLLSRPSSRRTSTLESTACASNLPSAAEIVDSSHAALSDSLITSNKGNSSSEYIISENGTSDAKEESTILTPAQVMVDSVSPIQQPAHPLTTDFTPAAMLAWRFPAAERSEQSPPGMKEPDALAALLSYRFESNDSRLPHYRKLLADPRTLDLAVIDGIVRSAFPDVRHHQDHLRGAWVTKQFRAYRAGLQVESTILAWANMPYGYAAIQTILEEDARWQAAQPGHIRQRPRPEKLIVDSSQLRDFWLNGGAWGLQGDWRGVDLDGELLTCAQYEQVRLLALEQVLADVSGSIELSPELEYEIATYHDWLTSPLLAHLPRKLAPFLRALEEVLDQERFALDVKIALQDDGRRRRVISVRSLGDPGQSWILRDGEGVDAFLAWYAEQSGQVHDEQQEGGEQQ